MPKDGAAAPAAEDGASAPAADEKEERAAELRAFQKDGTQPPRAQPPRAPADNRTCPTCAGRPVLARLYRCACLAEHAAAAKAAVEALAEAPAATAEEAQWKLGKATDGPHNDFKILTEATRLLKAHVAALPPMTADSAGESCANMANRNLQADRYLAQLHVSYDDMTFSIYIGNKNRPMRQHTMQKK